MIFLITCLIINNLSFVFFGCVVLSLVAGQKFKFHFVIQPVASLCFRVSSDSTEHR